MSTFKTTNFDIKPAVSVDGAGVVVSVIEKIVLPAATKLTDGDLLKFIKIPPYAKVVDYKIDFPEVDLDDGTATLTWSAGIMDNTDSALETAFVVDSTVGQTNAGTLTVPTGANIQTMLALAAAAAEKVFAIEITGTANGDSAAEATIYVQLFYAAA